MRINTDCTSEARAMEGDECLHVADVADWIAALPKGATLEGITRDFGSQRDPDERLVGLRARWSEGR